MGCQDGNCGENQDQRIDLEKEVKDVPKDHFPIKILCKNCLNSWTTTLKKGSRVYAAEVRRNIKCKVCELVGFCRQERYN